MNKHRLRLTYIFLLVFASFLGKSFAQDIEVIFHQTILSATPGEEMVFDFEVVNHSNMIQTVFEVRTINDLPAGWTSSLCFGELCFSPEADSVATTPEFSTPALNPGDTLITSLHVVTSATEGTGNVQLQIGTFRDPAVRITQDFVANSPLSVDEEESIPTGFYLLQNYPNPFNPSTKINFGLKESGHVSIKLFDVLGNEVAQLLNEYTSAGDHEINFNGSELTSGIYIYRLAAGQNSVTRKMILEK